MPAARRAERNPWKRWRAHPLLSAPTGRRNCRGGSVEHVPLIELDAVGPEHSQKFGPRTSFAPPGRKREKRNLDFFSSSAFHGLRVGRLRRRAAPPAATARRPVGARDGTAPLMKNTEVHRPALPSSICIAAAGCSPCAGASCPWLCARPLHDRDFFFGQAVEVVNQPVDFGLGCDNLAPDRPAMAFQLDRLGGLVL